MEKNYFQNITKPYDVIVIGGALPGQELPGIVLVEG